MYEDAARQPDQEPACEIGDLYAPEGHEAHHMHVVGLNGTDCSCGEVGGCFTVVVPDWTEQQWAEWEASLVCSICGKTGVQAMSDVFSTDS